MEPGTFKDRLLMEGDPHLLIEGIMLAAYAIEATSPISFCVAHTRSRPRGLQRAIAEA